LLQGQAERGIFLFMNGTPSHADTFDPKPALLEYEGDSPPGRLPREGWRPAF
jgi:hypothetical protein